jgi:hypothetical protein
VTSNGFSQFRARAWQYLVQLEDHRSRLFGIRYLDALTKTYSGEQIKRFPRPASPDQRLVRAELDRLFRDCLGKEPKSKGGRPAHAKKAD